MAKTNLGNESVVFCTLAARLVQGKRSKLKDLSEFRIEHIHREGSSCVFVHPVLGRSGGGRFYKDGEIEHRMKSVLVCFLLDAISCVGFDGGFRQCSTMLDGGSQLLQSLKSKGLGISLYVSQLLRWIWIAATPPLFDETEIEDVGDFCVVDATAGFPTTNICLQNLLQEICSGGRVGYSKVSALRVVALLVVDTSDISGVDRTMSSWPSAVGAPPSAELLGSGIDGPLVLVTVIVPMQVVTICTLVIAISTPFEVGARQGGIFVQCET
ncbi:uncharacterized protein G2W53_022302 [Senna tora]|uniref:Uncharacterized protein n=1 Tax=Senna tora TaxID=362788 RepID=A0A834TKZ7_9FABA|nr:uncharacterized protein G2W53_022302 [Senna tora]